MHFLFKPFCRLILIILVSSFAIPASARSSLEVNVLWPFLPGGISEFRYLMPIVNEQDRNMHGDLVLGVYSDYASKIVRDSEYGKVSSYAIKLGYRQYFTAGWHWESIANIGWREEINRPGSSNQKITGVAIRWWNMLGYQYNLSPIFYINFRGGFGTHLYRSDDYESTEKKNVIGFDTNIGVNF